LGPAVPAVGLAGYNRGAVTEQGFHVERAGSEVVLSVEVPAEAIRKKEQDLLALARARLNVPGFRPGRAPEHLVRRQYGEDEFIHDLKDDLIQEWLTRALSELGLHPVSTPTVETTAFDSGRRLAFRARFAVLPEVTIPDELAVDVPEPPAASITDEEVEGVLAGLRRDVAVLEPRGGPAQEGDVVRLERAGRDWEGEATATRPIGKQLLGATAGARVVLTDESGQSEAFAVTGVYRVVLPTPDETARHYGHSSWDAFAAAVREELHRVAEARRKTAWRLAALDAAADALQVEVPPSLLAESVADEMRELRLGPGQKPQLEGAVRRKLRREIVAQRLAEAKGLRPDEDEVRRRTEGRDRDEAAVRASLLLEQAADWIIAHARRNG